MAKKDSTGTQAEKKPRFNRIRQIFEAYRITRQVDSRVGLYTVLAFVVTLLVLVGIGAAIGHWIEALILGLPAAVLAALFVFGRRLERARYSQVEGQPGAAAAVLDTIRRGWTITPAVQFNKNQDLVHRAVGKPGIVLVGEGNPTRLRVLMTAERRFVQRVASDTPVTELIVGDGADQVSLPKLQRKLASLPRALKPAEVTAVNSRLRSLGDGKDRMPMPKGPMPKGRPPRR